MPKCRFKLTTHRGLVYTFLTKLIASPHQWNYAQFLVPKRDDFKNLVSTIGKVVFIKVQILSVDLLMKVLLYIGPISIILVLTCRILSLSKWNRYVVVPPPSARCLLFRAPNKRRLGGRRHHMGEDKFHA
jgi:hypothetical protein